ncbi:hypothetical protein HDZ31DRAFT_41032 [Schizophyllum fasciatum]
MECATLLERAASLANIDLQRNGFVPSTTDAQEIRRVSNELLADLQRVDSETQRLALVQQKLADQLAVNHSILAPVRRIPPEVLSEIFVCFAFAQADTKHPKEYSWAHLISTTVARVCTTWRAVARGTPQLWTYLSTSLDPESTRAMLLPEASLQQQLALTGALPLHLMHVTHHDTILRTFFAALRPHCARWHSLTIWGSYNFFDAQPVHNLPSLRTATVTMDGHPQANPLNFLSNASSLQFLRIENLPSELHSPVSPVLTIPSFPNLKSLDVSIRCPLPVDILSAIRPCKASLVDLIVDVMELHHSASEREPVVMESLAILQLWRATSLLLEDLITPALQSIGLSAIEGDPFPLLFGFLSRQQHPENLQELHLIEVNAPFEGATFLRCLPHLQHLRILYVEENSEAEPVMTENVLAALTCTDDRRPLLPNLACLELIVKLRHPWHAWKEALLTMYQSRQRPRVCASQPVVVLTLRTELQELAAE